MNLNQIAAITNGNIVTNSDYSAIDIGYAMASDLMSDVLTLDTDNTLLITGLANMQTIRTVEMQDVLCVLLARNKKATPEMIKIAEQNNITIIESPHAMFKISGILFAEGIKAHY
jgi:predicted transcriptional regulator